MVSRRLLLAALAGALASAVGAEATAIMSLEDLVGEEWASFMQQQLFLHGGSVQTEEKPADAAAPGMRSHPGSVVLSLVKHAQGGRQEPANVTDALDLDTLNATGVSLNAEGDLEIFVTGVFMYGFASVAMVAGFMFLSSQYPLIYQNNILKGFAPSAPAATRFGWLRSAWSTTTEQAAGSIGLDNALLLDFTMLAMRILAFIGAPMIFIMGPLHYIFGGFAAEKDHLSYFSMGNVKHGEGSWAWLYWVHAFVVWGVCFAVQVNIYSAMSKFLKLRYKWLRDQPEPRCTTVVVERIPEKYRSDEALKTFFNTMFEGQVQEAYVVKDTSALEAAIARKEAAAAGAQKATVKEDITNVEYYEKEKEAAQVQIVEERAKVKEAAKEIGGVNCSNGFVTFKDRSSAEIAKMVSMGPDVQEWAVSTPPDASDVMWGDLQEDHYKATGKTLLGYGLIVGLYFVYLPLVIGITQIANSIDMGFLQPIWASVAPTLGLQILVGFLPTILVLIADICFVQRAQTELQHSVQKFYFVFQVVFVVMITAVGGNVAEFSQTMLTFTCTPFDTFSLLGDTMPSATHFYMNFMVMQWMTHCLNLTRYIQLIKFRAASAIWEQEEARELAEPEDQDYYGLGSRSARFTTNMIIAIIYGAMCPWMYLLTFINFATCRTVYGYLIPFAETKKGDLGGYFYVTQLRHLFIGNLIYVAVMTGVLYGRSPTGVPATIAISAGAYVVWSMIRFESAFSWEILPFEEIQGGNLQITHHGKVPYVQPCLLEDK